MTTRALCIVAALAACGRAGDQNVVTSAPTPQHVRDASNMSSSKTLWQPRSVAAHGITVEFVDGSPVSEGDASEQHFVLQRSEGVLAAVRIGAAMTLAWWRTNFGERRLAFSPESATTLCGRPAVRQEVTVPAETATGLVPSPSGIGHFEQRTPAEVHVAVAGATAKGTAFVATWVVAESERAARRNDEDHFFASIRCD